MVQCKLVSKLLHERRRKNLFKSTTHDFSNCDECFAYEHLTEKSTKLTKTENVACHRLSTVQAKIGTSAEQSEKEVSALLVENGFAI